MVGCWRRALVNDHHCRSVRIVRLPRDVTVAVAARGVMSASRAMAGTIVPIYLAKLGFSGTRLGAVFVAVGVASAVMTVAIGLLADRWGRKPFLVAVPLLAAVAASVFAATTVQVALFLGAMVGTFGRGAGAGGGSVGPYQPAEQALIGAAVVPAARNRAFGRLAFASACGALAGGLMASLAPGHVSEGAALAGFRLSFIVMAVLAAAAGAMALLLRDDAPVVPTSQPPGGRLSRYRLPRRSLPLLMRLWATNSVNGLAVGMFGPFITYWFYRKFGATAPQVGELYAVVNAATLVSTLSAAPLAKRFGLVRTTVAGRAIQAVLLVPMVAAPGFWVAGGVYLIRMLAQRAALPLRQSYVMAAADPAERGAVAALSNLPSQATSSVTPLLGGFLFDEVSVNLPMLCAAALQLTNAVMYYAFFASRPPEEERAAAAASPEAHGARPATVLEPRPGILGPHQP